MEKYTLSKLEQETIILFNEAEELAECYTHNKSLQKQLDGFCSKSTEITLTKQDSRSKTYTFPKKWLKVRMPRTMSEKQLAQLEKMRERAKKAKTSDDKQ